MSLNTSIIKGSLPTPSETCPHIKKSPIHEHWKPSSVHREHFTRAKFFRHFQLAYAFSLDFFVLYEISLVYSTFRTNQSEKCITIYIAIVYTVQCTRISSCKQSCPDRSAVAQIFHSSWFKWDGKECYWHQICMYRTLSRGTLQRRLMEEKSRRTNFGSRLESLLLTDGIFLIYMYIFFIEKNLFYFARNFICVSLSLKCSFLWLSL